MLRRWWPLVVLCLVACDAHVGEPGLDGGGGGGGSGGGSGGGGGGGSGGGSSAFDAGVDAGDEPVADAGPLPDGGLDCTLRGLPLRVTATRGDGGVAHDEPGGDYAATVMLDGRYRAWWCNQDRILAAEADSLDGPWFKPGTTEVGAVVALGPSGAAGAFDRTSVCDPSVIRVESNYYLYYSGFDATEDAGSRASRIGLATSPDGLTWTRALAGAPVVTPARAPGATSNPYGAGQPSATFVGGKFHLAFVDTSNSGSDPSTGGGQFAWRSTDPTFQTSLEQWGPQGFVSMDGGRSTSAFTTGFSADWQFSDALQGFVVGVASEVATDGTELRFFDSTLTRRVGTVKVPGESREGPALVGRPDRHALSTPDCGRLDVEVLGPVGAQGLVSWGLGRSGASIATGRPCACVDFGQVYEGAVLVAPGRADSLVREAKRVEFFLPAPSARLSRNRLMVPATVVDAVPLAASFPVGVRSVIATGRPGGFEIDGGVWPIDCAALISDNQSTLTSISVAEWDALTVKPALRCLR